MPDDLDFTALIDPIRVENFFAQYWEKRPLHIRRCRNDFYTHLLSAGDIDDLITRRDTRYPAIRIAKGGAFYPPEAYTRDIRYGDDCFNGVTDVDKVFTAYLAGATVTLPALHRTWPPLARLCATLEAQFDHVVHANAYVTPAGASGFTPHYDTHEVFVLQIAGTKRWRIYPPPIELPHRSQPFAAENYRLPATPLAEVDLTTGDLLYLPRGYVHTASTSDTFSVHVTVGVGVFTWIDLAAELLQSLSGTARHRRALPPGFASRPELQRPLQEQLAELIGQLGKDADYERTLASFTGRVRAAQPRIETTFRANVTAIGPATRLKIAAAQDSYTILHDRDSVILEAQGRRILLPGAVELALNAICAGNIFQPQALPGALDLDDKLALVRHLHGIGFLQVARLRAGV